MGDINYKTKDNETWVCGLRQVQDWHSYAGWRPSCRLGCILYAELCVVQDRFNGYYKWTGNIRRPGALAQNGTVGYVLCVTTPEAKGPDWEGSCYDDTENRVFVAKCESLVSKRK